MDQASARTFLYDFGRDRYREASLAVLGFEGELRYGGAPEKKVPADDLYWARISTQVVDEDQETLRNGEVRRFVTSGLVFVQLFCPVVDKRALPAMDAIAEAVRRSFRTYQGEEVEFTNARINDSVANEPNWLRANVTSEYQYRQFM